MNYKETLNYLYDQLPMYQRVGTAAFKKDLTNIKLLCNALGNPERKFKSVHIAGTNGKGSVSHMTASILQSQGYRVGMYTSPHYKDFRERIKINGVMMPKDKVIRFVEETMQISEEIKPSFFEITVAMAFYYFAEEEVDYGVIEVGLGGRLDSTNIILPEVSVITNISFDHEAMLGNTLALIAGEKAGIIKKGIPVVIGERNEETTPVFDAKAQEMEAPIIYAEDVIEFISENEEGQFEFQYNNSKIKIKMPFPGPFQKYNIRTTLGVCKVLEEKGIIDFNSLVIANAFSSVKENTYYLGRWEKLGENPLIIADSAHNEGGLKKVMIKINAMDIGHKHFVLGFVNDKDLNKALPFFPNNAKYYFAKANIPRGLDAEKLRLEAKQFGLTGRSYISVKNALAAAKRAAQPDDLIYVGGSIFVVAEVI